MAQRQSKLAAQYLRVSSAIQDLTMAQQAAAIAAYAGRHKYKIVRTYSDPGLSGLTLAARPGLQQLLKDTLKGERTFGAILVYDVSRWGRFQDIDEGAHYEFLCKRAGAPVVYCAEHFQNDGSPTSELIKQFRRAAAAEHSREISERIRYAQEFLNAQGFRAAGFAPYGYERLAVAPDGSSLRLSRGEGEAPPGWRTRLVLGPPGEVDTVKRIFRMYADEQLRVADIAAELRKEGVAGPRGEWREGSVRQILRSEAYVGVSVFGRRRRELGGRVGSAPRDDWIRTSDAWPRMVSDSLFAKAVARLALRGGYSDDDLLHLLSALLKKHGRLTSQLIDSSPETPKAAAYRLHFGSLAAAYAKIGYRPVQV